MSHDAVGSVNEPEAGIEGGASLEFVGRHEDLATWSGHHSDISDHGRSEIVFEQNIDSIAFYNESSDKTLILQDIESLHIERVVRSTLNGDRGLEKRLHHLTQSLHLVARLEDFRMSNKELQEVEDFDEFFAEDDWQGEEVGNLFVDAWEETAWDEEDAEDSAFLTELKRQILTSSSR